MTAPTPVNPFDMSRKTIVSAVLACVMVAYIATVIPLANKAERNDTFDKMVVKVNNDAETNFLRKSDVYDMLRNVTYGFDSMQRKDISTLEIEEILNSNSRIEQSTCRILNDGTLLITVDPLDPVARVFDSKGSVYVNTSGKRVAARPEYHIDVPVVTTPAVADSAMVAKLLPILRAIKSDKSVNALVSTLCIDNRGDIIIIPNIVGHVINFGDTTLISNKFDRLRVFYRDVMPSRGWDAFDTISVKWAGQVVATKRNKNQTTGAIENIADLVDEVLDDGVMMTDE